MRPSWRRLRIVGLRIGCWIHCSIGCVRIRRILLIGWVGVIILVRMMISLVGIAWPPRHRIIHRRRLLLRLLLLLLLLLGWRWRRRLLLLLL